MLQLADADLIWQQCLFAFEEPSIDADFSTVTRTWLDDTRGSTTRHDGCTAPIWCSPSSIAVLPWQQREVTMYDRRLPEPRLTAWWNTAVARCRGACRCSPTLAPRLTDHYSRPFDSIGFNLYRDGHDSVAWHGDRERFELEDPTVAIVSTGQPRPFHLRPRGGGASRSWQSGSRRPVRDGWFVPARLAALRAEGRRRRASPVDHVPPQLGRIEVRD